MREVIKFVWEENTKGNHICSEMFCFTIKIISKVWSILFDTAPHTYIIPDTRGHLTKQITTTLLNSLSIVARHRYLRRCSSPSVQ